MLVLSRKKNESIVISDNITVKVLEVRGNRVRLGIAAPEGVSIHREELGWVELSPGTAPNFSEAEVEVDCLIG